MRTEEALGREGKSGRIADLNRWMTRAVEVLALSIAIFLLSATLLLVLTKVSPIDAVVAMVQGSLGSISALGETLVRAIPIGFIAIGAGLAFRGGVFNVGGDGQMAIGALGAFTVLTVLSSSSPVLVWFTAGIAATAFGITWAMVPALLELTKGVSVILTTLLMNYIAFGVVTWLTLAPWAFHDSSSIIAQSHLINRSLNLPILLSGTRLHLGVILLLAVILVAAWYEGTKRGMLDEIQGANARLAQLAGVNTSRNRVRLLFISAGLAGLAGFAQVAGADHLLNPSVTGGVGYTALLVAVLGRGRPVPTAFIATLFAALFTSGDALEGIGVGLPLVVVIQALIVIAGALPSRVWRFLSVR